MSQAIIYRLSALLLLGFTAGLCPAADPPVADADVFGWVDQRVRAWQPTAAERRFDDIGWLTDIRAAERLAREHQRPVFLFSHDGRMALGRC